MLKVLTNLVFKSDRFSVQRWSAKTLVSLVAGYDKVPGTKEGIRKQYTGLVAYAKYHN